MDLTHPPPWYISVHGYLENEKWYLEVTDSGLGFDPILIDKFKELMATPIDPSNLLDLHIGGMGLINICTRLKLMYREKAIFTITNLPRRRHNYINKWINKKGGNFMMQLTMKYKVIVVEDEALIRRSIVKKIQALNLGFTVVGTAMDGQSALNMIESELPHLVITDIRMPIMDGLELVKNIYFAYPSIKVIILSGFHEFEFARQAIKYAVNDYLLKPVTTEQLSTALTKIKLQLDSNLTSLINLANSKSRNVTPEELVKTVELYIRTNYKNELTLEDIAKSLNFSSDYLSRIYKKSTGKSPFKIFNSPENK